MPVAAWGQRVKDRLGLRRGSSRAGAAGVAVVGAPWGRAGAAGMGGFEGERKNDFIVIKTTSML